MCLHPATISKWFQISRKDKSLGLLCDKFISRFPREVPPSERCEIPLDDLAKQMSTERRRIYDIVNVLEAVQMMTKVRSGMGAPRGQKKGFRIEKSETQSILLNVRFEVHRGDYFSVFNTICNLNPTMRSKLKV